MDTILKDMTEVNLCIIFVAFLMFFGSFLGVIYDKVTCCLEKIIKNDNLVFLIAVLLTLEFVGLIASIIDYCCKYYLGKA